MKTLETLIKLQKSLIDEQRQHLARLQDHLDNVLHRIAELEVEKAREQLAAEAHPEARTTYGAYVRRAADRGKQLEIERVAAQQAVDIAHARLAEMFEEQKRYEIAEEARLEAEAREESRREGLQMDEVGGMTHERRRNNDKID